MADNPVSSTTPKKGRRWLRLLGWLVGGVLLLLVALYFVATSAAFFKGFILPRVAKAANAEITVSDASVSPFHQLTLKDLKVKTTGADPLLSIPEVRLRYSLMDIIGGNMNVAEVAILSPTVVVVVNPDGTSNLDPFTKPGAKAQTQPSKSVAQAKPAKPLQIDVKKLTLTGATIRYTQVYTNGNRDVYEASNVNLSLADFKNGQVGRLTLAAAVRAQMNLAGQHAPATVQANLSGTVDVGLTPDAKLATAKGAVHVGVDKADGPFAQAAAFAVDLDYDLTPTDLKAVVLRCQRGATALGQVRASGPFDMAKLEGRIVLEIPSLDKTVLNLAATGMGLEFGATVLHSTNTIVLAQSASQITIGGQIGINALQVALTNLTTPALDLLANYDVSLDRAKSNTVVRAFDLKAVQDGRSILHAETTAPVTLSSATGTNVMGDVALALGLTGLDLAKWKTILGNVLPAGVVNAEMKVLAKQGGQQLTLELTSAVDNLTLPPASQSATNANPSRVPTSLSAKLAANFAVDRATGLSFPAAKGSAHFGIDRAQGSLSELASFSTDLDCDVTPTQIKGVSVRFAKGGTSLGEVRASGPFDLAKTEGHIVLEVSTIDKRLLNLAAAGKGLDFGTTLIQATNTIDLANSGQLIKAGGQIDVTKLQVTLTNETTPTLDFQAAYDVTVDRAQSNAVLRAVNLTCLQQGSPILHAGLSSPMTLNWGKAAAGVGDSTFGFDVTGLDLAQWKPILGAVAPSGVINAQGKLVSQQTGKQLTLDLNSSVENLTVVTGTNSLAQAGVAFQMNGKASDFTLFSLNQFKLEITQRKQSLLTASGSAAFDQAGDTSNLKLNVRLMIGRVLQALSVPVASAVSNAPSQMDLALDVALNKKVADLRQVQLSLAPTARATNQIQLTGQVDTTLSNALQGSLRLTADSLDFTSYYDLFTGTAQAPAAQPAAPAKPATTRTPGAPAAAQTQEPPPMQFPIRSLTVNTTIRRLYLHEVEVADFHAGTKLDTNHVTVDPFKLSLNGAPVSASLALDLSVPGFKYDVNLTATNVPIPPFISSFQPERKGQISGTLTAQGNITGAGITGPSLQTNLAGHFYCGTTNLNLAAQNVQNKILRTVVEVVVLVPDLIKNPASGASALLSRLTGSTNNPTPNDLQHSVINSIVLRGNAGSGKLLLQQASVSGPTFLAEAPTTVTLNPVLTNSALNVPVSISLSRDVAQTIHFMPTNTPTNAAYVKLPDFFTMKGTVGAPKKDLNYLALAGGVAPAIGGKPGSIIQGVTSLLGGSKTNAPTGSNAPAGGLLQGLGNLLNKPPASTNSPSTQTNATPLNNLIDGLFGPKKN